MGAPAACWEGGGGGGGDAFVFKIFWRGSNKGRGERGQEGGGGDEMAGGGWGWRRRVVVVEAVDGCLICERVRVERSRQEENKTHRGSRAEQSKAVPGLQTRAEPSRGRQRAARRASATPPILSGGRKRSEKERQKCRVPVEVEPNRTESPAPHPSVHPDEL